MSGHDRLIQDLAEQATAINGPSCESPDCIYSYHVPRGSMTWAIWTAAGRPINPKPVDRCPALDLFRYHTPMCGLSDDPEEWCAGCRERSER